MEVVAEGDESSNDSTSTKEDEDDVTPMEVVAEKAAEPEVQKTILNLEEGLSDLMKISQSFKSIDEEPSDAKDKPSTSGKFIFFGTCLHLFEIGELLLVSRLVLLNMSTILSSKQMRLFISKYPIPHLEINLLMDLFVFISCIRDWKDFALFQIGKELEGLTHKSSNNVNSLSGDQITRL